MKNTLVKTILRFTVLSGLVLSALSQAALINRGSGLIYDDVLDVTWMQNADFIRTSGFDDDGIVNYATASNWADSLSFGGYDDWRLPNRAPLDGATYNFGFSFDGSTDRGFNDFGQTSELSYMFYHNLANSSYFDTSGNPMQAGSETFNSSFIDGETGELFSFENIGITYWSDPVDDPIVNAAWGFNNRAVTVRGGFATGEHQLLSTNAEIAVWALRNGDVMSTISGIDPPVAVNSPGTFAMLFFGVVGTLAARRQKLS